jgi:hypothetical protein
MGFVKTEFSESFNHEEKISQKFREMGYNNFKIKTVLTNGCSHYVSLCVNVANDKKLPFDSFTFDGKIVLSVRISDHDSNLEKFGGWEGGSNKCSLLFFYNLREKGAIELNN